MVSDQLPLTATSDQSESRTQCSDQSEGQMGAVGALGPDIEGWTMTEA